MHRAASVLLTAALAVSALAVEGEEPTADPLLDHPCYDEAAEALVYPEQQVWFHEGDTKLGNQAAAPWDTTEPTTSVTGGAGAGALSSNAALLAENAPAATFAGTFTGCIDTLLFDLYSFDPTNRTGTSGSAQPAAHDLGLSITIDGNVVFSKGPLEVATTLANEGVGPNLNRFALDLGDLLESYAAFGALQLDGEHTIEVRVRSWYANTGHAVYAWDTTEVPSGLLFNGEITEDYAKVG